jgi:hypothetical protein
MRPLPPLQLRAAYSLLLVSNPADRVRMKINEPLQEAANHENAAKP